MYGKRRRRRRRRRGRKKKEKNKKGIKEQRTNETRHSQREEGKKGRKRRRKRRWRTDYVHSAEHVCTHLTRRESVGRREWPLITIHDSLNCILYAVQGRFLFRRVLREEVARPVSSYDRGTRCCVPIFRPVNFVPLNSRSIEFSQKNTKGPTSRDRTRFFLSFPSSLSMKMILDFAYGWFVRKIWLSLLVLLV